MEKECSPELSSVNGVTGGLLQTGQFTVITVPFGQDCAFVLLSSCDLTAVINRPCQSSMGVSSVIIYDFASLIVIGVYLIQIQICCWQT